MTFLKGDWVSWVYQLKTNPNVDGETCTKKLVFFIHFLRFTSNHM